jgi:hypothetical protein
LETLLHELVRGLFDCRLQSSNFKMVLMTSQELKLRTKKFALRIISFWEALPKDETSRTLGKQLLRSGTSVAANYRAVCRAKSTADFISKFGNVLEETPRVSALEVAI